MKLKNKIKLHIIVQLLSMLFVLSAAGSAMATGSNNQYIVAEVQTSTKVLEKEIYSNERWQGNIHIKATYDDYIYYVNSDGYLTVAKPDGSNPRIIEDCNEKINSSPFARVGSYIYYTDTNSHLKKADLEGNSMGSISPSTAFKKVSWFYIQNFNDKDCIIAHYDGVSIGDPTYGLISLIVRSNGGGNFMCELDGSNYQDLNRGSIPQTNDKIDYWLYTKPKQTNFSLSSVPSEENAFVKNKKTGEETLVYQPNSVTEVGWMLIGNNMIIETDYSKHFPNKRPDLWKVDNKLQMEIFTQYNAEEIHSTDRYMYFIKESDLYLYNNDNKSQKLLAEDVEIYKLYNDKIYYQSYGTINSMDLDGNGKKKLFDDEKPGTKAYIVSTHATSMDYSLLIKDNYIYFTGLIPYTGNSEPYIPNTQAIYRIKVDGTGLEKVMEASSSWQQLVLIASNNKYLYTRSVDEKLYESTDQHIDKLYVSPIPPANTQNIVQNIVQSPAVTTNSKPILQVVNQPSKEYKKGDTINFTVTSPNYGGRVEYRVILYNGTTKNTTNLWSTANTGYYYKNWQPSGDYKFNISWLASQLEPGAYSMTVLVRKVGSKVQYDSYADTQSFWVVE